jgi:hypothetical protein
MRAGSSVPGQSAFGLDAIAAGQMETSLALIEPETRAAAGRALAIIDVSDEMHDYKIP